MGRLVDFVLARDYKVPRDTAPRDVHDSRAVSGILSEAREYTYKEVFGVDSNAGSRVGKGEKDRTNVDSAYNEGNDDYLYSNQNYRTRNGTENGIENTSKNARKLGIRNSNTSHDSHLMHDENMHILIDEIKKIKYMIDESNASHVKCTGLEYIIKKMHNFGLPEGFVNNLIELLKEKNTFNDLNDADKLTKGLKEYIFDNIYVYNEKKNKAKCKKMVLIGASGVGKTSTVFKLAAYHGRGDSTVKVVNFDNQKVAARESMDKTVNYMDIEGKSFIDIEELVDYMKKKQSSDFLFIDTTSYNPRNLESYSELRGFLGQIPSNSELFLVIPANLSEQNILSSLEQFTTFNFDGVIITKVDESTSPAAVFSVCIEKNIPIAYISTGRDYYQNFIKATKEDVAQYFENLFNV